MASIAARAEGPGTPVGGHGFDGAVAAVLIPAVRRSFVTSVLSIVVFSVLLAWVDPAGFAAWLAIRVLVSVACFGALGRLVERTVEPSVGSLVVIMGISGVVWGLLPAFVQPADPEWYAVVALWIFGNQSVVTAVCAADRRVFASAVGSVTAIGAITMLMGGGGFRFVLAGLIVLGGAYAFSVFAAVHQSTVAAIDARLESDALALSLRERQAELTAANATLEALAHGDVMTGLPNRRGLIAAVVDDDRRVRGSGWMGIADLDGFKRINDSRGHVAGDRVLVEVARRWALALDGAYIARTGGDEFAFVVGEDADVESLADRMQRCLDEPVIADDGDPVDVAGSIGIGRFDRGETLSDVMTRADAALYAAKAAGRAQVSIDAFTRADSSVALAAD